jgi:L-lactate dehydrogenase complex protein LldG
MIEITSTAELPGAIAGYLRSHNQPLRVRMGADARLSAVPWSREPSLSVDRGSAMASDTASVTHALAAVAETGTALIASGPDNPVTLSFLPETNFIVVARADIVGPLEEALARVPRTAMPRTLNLVTGPSRSADIGGIPVLGAHGPRRLCLILVG